MLGRAAISTPREVSRGPQVDEVEDREPSPSHEVGSVTQPTPAELKQYDWYHEHCDRQRAELMLDDLGLVDGSFIIRPSSSESGKYVLTLVFSGEIQHVLVEPHPSSTIINCVPLEGLSLPEVRNSYTSF